MSRRVNRHIVGNFIKMVEPEAWIPKRLTLGALDVGPF